MQLIEASQQYLMVRQQDGYSSYTLTAYRFQHQALIRDLGNPDVTTITLEDFRRHLGQYPHLQPASLGHKIRAIKSLFRWLEDEDLCVPNPTRKLKEPKLGQRVPKALTVDELEWLRDACVTTRDHALVEFFFATGCRVGEVYRLNRQDWDGYHQAILVLGKGNKEREVYLGSKARIWLHRYLTERQDHDPALFVTERAAHRLSIHGIQQTFKRIASRCGLAPKVHPHVLRHTLATTLLNQGAPLVAVQSILGHEKPETTQLYAVLSGEARHHAYQRYFVQ